ncbi:MAG TPA: T9SS type A sorting domain-containing protein [Chitinophagales bacterium]|nr:T9SS type A sorting domain-containing protein [Chitinophagales bacterium]
MFPNPASDIVQIKGLSNQNTVTVSNNLGRVLKSFENLESNFSVSDLSKGIYSITIYSAHKEIIQTLQLIVQ